MAKAGKPEYTHISDDEIGELLVKFHGNIAQVARTLEVARCWVHGRIAKNEELQTILQDTRESMLDNAESVLQNKILSGESDTLLIFFLKTQGWKRGYGRQGDYDPETSKSKIILVDRDGVLRIAQDDTSQ